MFLVDAFIAVLTAGSARNMLPMATVLTIQSVTTVSRGSDVLYSTTCPRDVGDQLTLAIAEERTCQQVRARMDYRELGGWFNKDV